MQCAASMITTKASYSVLLLCMIVLAACTKESSKIVSNTEAVVEDAAPFRVVAGQAIEDQSEPEELVNEEDKAALIKLALNEMRKSQVDFDKFYVKTLVGDLDSDGKNDVVMEYGVGAEDAMKHVYNVVRIFMQEEQGLRLLPYEIADGYCADIRAIQNEYLLINELEACALPFAESIGYYTYFWNGEKIIQSDEVRIEQRIIDELNRFAEELITPTGQGIDGRVSDNLSSIHRDELRLPAIKKALNALQPIGFTMADDQKSAAAEVSVYNEAIDSHVEYHLAVDLVPKNSSADVRDKALPASAVIELKWSRPFQHVDERQDDGTATFYVLNDKLYLIRVSK
jgi:hypothetical protein